MWGKVSSLRKGGKWNQMPPMPRERRNQIWSFRWLDGGCSCSEAEGPNSALIKSLMLQWNKHDLLCIAGMKQGHRRSHSNKCLSSAGALLSFTKVVWGMCPQRSQSTAGRVPCLPPWASAWDQPTAGKSHPQCQLELQCPQGTWWDQPSQCSKTFFVCFCLHSVHS